MERMIANERPALADSLWIATAHPAPPRPALRRHLEADTVVVGAGFTGLSAALHLAEAGQRVVVLDAESPGWGASGRNGGQVNPGLKPDPEVLVAKFGADLGGRMVSRWGGGGDLVFDLIARHRIDCDPRRVGFLRAAVTPRTLAALRETGRQWRAKGADVPPVEADEMARMIGADAFLGGIIDRRGGNLHPLNFALGLAAAAERAGAVIHGQSRVREISPEGGAIVARTEAGSVTARRAILATNAYTQDLADPLGRTLVPVTSVQVATAPLSQNILSSILPENHAPTDTRRLITYFRKTTDGRFVIGGRGALGEASTRRRQQALRDVAVTLFPQLGDARWAHAWGGSAAMTRSGLPGLHLLAPNVMAGLSFNGRGVASATVMGTILADWARGMPLEALDYPVTAAQPIPFHRFRQVGVGATVAALRMLDRLRL
ncbi:MAG: FAD-binding oxidoreductase [Pseudomonadota bacterium]